MKSFEHSMDSAKDMRRAQFYGAQLGALYGLLAGSAFALLAVFLDVVLYRDLPLGVDWAMMAIFWVGGGLGLAVIGFVTCWALETWRGVFAGMLTAAGLLLVASLYQSQVNLGTKFLVLIFILLPIAAIVLPVAWLLRWLAERHARVRRESFPAAKIALLVLIATLLGAGGGFFMRKPPDALTAIRFVHERILAADEAEANVFQNLPGFREHLDTDFKLYEVPSTTSTEGFVVTATYEDGYSLSCLVVVYPGRDPFLSNCQTANAASR